MLGLGTGAALAATTSAASVTIAAVFARKLVTPEKEKPNDADVLTVRHGLDGVATSAVFAPSVESLAPGRYGLYWDDERGHAHAAGHDARGTGRRRSSLWCV